MAPCWLANTMVATSITINVVTSTINVATRVAASINKRLCQHADDKSLIESTMVWHERRHLAFAVANCVFNLRFSAALLGAAAMADCWRGPQYDEKCSFYFKCYFFRITPTNWDLREKAVYFRPWTVIIEVVLIEGFLYSNYNFFFKSDVTIKKWILEGNEKNEIRKCKLKTFYLNFTKNKRIMQITISSIYGSDTITHNDSQPVYMDILIVW